MKTTVILACIAICVCLCIIGCDGTDDSALDKAAPKVDNPKKEVKAGGAKAPLPPQPTRPTK